VIAAAPADPRAAVPAQLLRGITLASGGAPLAGPVDVTLDGDGVVLAVAPSAERRPLLLAPPAVDLHLDVLARRARPRADVDLPLATVLAGLDAEALAAGCATVCLAARFEEEPARGLSLQRAVDLCRTLPDAARGLGCAWRIHARIALDEPDAPDALAAVLAAGAPVAVISLVDHGGRYGRFASAAQRRDFYAEDWQLPPDEVEAVFARRARHRAGAERRREAVAWLAHAHGVALASHDDPDAAAVERARRLGATICEFPLGLPAAMAARRAGMAVVLGAPNAMRGRSTVPGNLTVADAARHGAADALCSDYLPAALPAAPLALAAAGVPLARALAMTTTAPARLLGAPTSPIAPAAPLTAVLLATDAPHPRALAQWRAGELIHLATTHHHGDRS
jgi:alpha-D-ribose 1-methylphosphonate 5-triphosphate diphosphatase